jgi:hypothetical protein
MSLPIVTNDQSTKEKRKAAIEYDGLLIRGLHENLFLLKAMHDNKLYSYLGFQSLEGYCKDRLGMARQTMYHYLNVATKFLPESPEVSPGRLFNLGIAKMKILAVLDETATSELTAKAEIMLSSNIYSIEDLKEMTVDALRKLITGGTTTPKTVETDPPFNKVYFSIEKCFREIIKNVLNCSAIPKSDKAEIQYAITGVIEVLDRTRKLEGF